MQNKFFSAFHHEDKFGQTAAMRRFRFGTAPRGNGNTPQVSSGSSFNESDNSFLVKRAMAVAGRMALLLEGRQVLRTYLEGPADKPPVVMYLVKLRAGQDGVIRLYDSEDNVREFPVESVEFEFDEPNKLVKCNGPDFVLVLQAVELG